MTTLHPMLKPYQPTRDDPFDAVKAGHLLSRAGFGGTPEEIDKVMQLGPAGSVDWLLDFPEAGADEQSNTDLPDLSSVAGYPSSFKELQLKARGMTPEERQEFKKKLMQANREALVQTSGWWLRRMARGPHPLQEKLTLFWHGHFTTSAKDERAALLMWNQNELLRRQAAGNFREFVRAISRDPAMLDYLNNNQNRKAHPNENYARELMELFTLGIGNYSEDDVKQAARAFTGWGHDGDDFIFRKYEHDDGAKTFFGHEGRFDGDDVINMILAHPACARYITGKMFRYFVYEDAEDGVTQSLAGILHDARWDMRPMLRTMFNSQAFYSSKAIGSQIKSPIQLLVGTVRLLGLEMPPARMLAGSLIQMGQVPLEPPNVKGWAGGRTWINTSTLFVRYNTAVFLAGGGGEMPALYGKKIQKPRIRMESAKVKFDPTSGGETASEVVDYWIARLVQRPVETEKKKILLETLGNKSDDAQSVRKMVQLIVSMPEYQLC